MIVQEDPHALSTLRLVFLDAGDRDEHGLQLGARRLGDALRARSIPLQQEEFSGGHRNTGHRYETSLPALIRVLDLS